MNVEVREGAFVVDAALVSEMLGVAAAEVPTLMRNRAITSLCEQGADTDEGRFRLSFFYRNRRARLSVDSSGRVLQRSIIDFGPMPRPGRARALTT